MAKLPGLFRRDGIYQLRVVVPKRLQALYSGKTKLIQSLSTANRYEAGVLGSLHRAKMLGHFAQNGHESALPKLDHNQFALSLTAPGTATRLTELFDQWKLSKERSVDAVNACRRALALYKEYTGDPALSALNRAQGDGFRAWLQLPERNTTIKTARDRLTTIIGL